MDTLKAKEASNGQVTAATDVIPGNLKQRWELFRVARDYAWEFVESVKLRIRSECLVVVMNKKQDAEAQVVIELEKKQDAEAQYLNKMNSRNIAMVLYDTDGGSFDNVTVNFGIDISRKVREVSMAALNIKSEIDGA
nr:mediator of RNA polymerase II transcription subunit 32 [Tanacetum cinerariifolium]